jgi:hypothetical protein
MKPLKKEKGWRISTLTVTVKHWPHESRTFMAQDIREALADRDEIKAVRVKVGKATGGAA